MIRKITFVAGLIFSLQMNAQTNYQVKVMSWNILNWPEVSNLAADSTARCPAYRTVVSYANPDILITNENTASYSTTLFLNQVMNANGNEYRAGTFINGYDTDNGIFYRDTLFHFVSNVPIHTALRDINQFTLVFKPTGDTLRIYSLHLKAAQGYESNRALEVANLRNVTNALPAGSNFLVGGDFNIYESGEPAYVALLQDNPGDDGNFNDVWNMPGIWNDPAYSHYHTQSTRYNSGSSGSGGGMDDRFDMILYSNGLAQPGGIDILTNTYTNIGNDGNHYNASVNFGSNSAVPTSVANALYTASDHLPVSVDLLITAPLAIMNPDNKIAVQIAPNPVSNNSIVTLNLIRPSEIEYSITDISGKEILKSDVLHNQVGTVNLTPSWEKITNSGFYFLRIRCNNQLIINKLSLFR